MINSMEMEFIYLVMEKDMRECCRITKEMEEGNSIILMALYMRENGILTKNMVKDN